jgi:tRNA pseudouridine55 synthase
VAAAQRAGYSASPLAASRCEPQKFRQTASSYFEMFGILNINKPMGWTSRDVVNRVQRFVRPAKVGHAGTLDPLATGVLVVCIGGATRLIEYVQRLPKAYLATFLLGRSSPSDDVESDIQLHENVAVPSRQEIEAMLPKFLGTIMQRPPAFSAVHVNGQRAYKLARQGLDIELPPRSVTIYSIELQSYRYPELTLAIQCGSGTYIRSLGRDLAHSLDTYAVMSALERTWIGKVHIDKSVDVNDLEGRIHEHILSPHYLVDSLTRVRLTQEEIHHLGHGRTIARGDRQVEPARWPSADSPATEIVGVDYESRIVAILQATEDDMFRPLRNFAP